MDQFDYEKLDVYKVSFQYVVISHKICKMIPRGSGHLVDQLQRASTSILLNVCAGAGEFSKGDKAKFYRIGKRSATECSAILEILQPNCTMAKKFSALYSYRVTSLRKF